jgi:hypothetical protein
MKSEEIQVKNCRECPFANNDNEYGYDNCNAPNNELELLGYEQLPEQGVHERCPLKKSDLIVKLTTEFLKSSRNN